MGFVQNNDIIENFNNNIAHSYGRYHVSVEGGGNCSCTDADGKKYIDFGSGIGVNSLGFCDEKWADAVCRQVRTK